LLLTLSKQGKSRTDAKNIYWAASSFAKWPIEIWKKLPGFGLLIEHGIFHATKNKNGAVRDHMLSKSHGWENGIAHSTIAHPANCQIILNFDNIKKGVKSSISHEQLLREINNF